MEKKMKNKPLINMLFYSIIISSPMIDHAFAECPNTKDVASAIKFKPFLNPGMSITPINRGEEFIIGELMQGSNTRTGINAPKNLRLIDRVDVCHYREGTIMAGITFSVDLVPLKNFDTYWHNHQLSGIFYGDYNKAQELLKKSIERSKIALEESKKMAPPL